MQPLAAITITGADFDIALVPDGIAAAIPPDRIKVANESPFALQLGLGGYIDWLPAWTVDVVPVRGVTSMHVHPVPLTSPMPAPPWSTLLVTTIAPYEAVAGTFPASLDRLSAAYSEQTLVANVSAGANATVTKPSLSVPAGTQSIGYLVRSDAGNDTPQLVTIQGTQSRNDYTTARPQSNIGGVNWYPFSTTDTSVDVTLHASVVNPSSIDVLASPLALAVDITNPFGNLLDVLITDPSSNTPLGVDNSGTPQASLLVSMVDANPAVWQSPALIARFASSVAAGGTGIVIAAAGGKQLRLWDLLVSADTGTATSVIGVQDTTGANLLDFRMVPTVQRADLEGVPFGALGAGLQVHNFDVGANVIRVTAVYRQV